MSIPVEVETTLQRLSSHWSVKGVMILDNTSWRVVQYSGSMLEAAESDGKQQKMESNGIPENSGDDGVAGPTSVENGQPLSSAVSKYAAIVRRIVISSKEGIEAGDDDKVRFLRIRTRNYELMITPEDRYTLVVVHDPNPA